MESFGTLALALGYIAHLLAFATSLDGTTQTSSMSKRKASFASIGVLFETTLSPSFIAAVAVRRDAHIEGAAGKVGVWRSKTFFIVAQAD